MGEDDNDDITSGWACPMFDGDVMTDSEMDSVRFFWRMEF
jgi:hypothetical protein